MKTIKKITHPNLPLILREGNNKNKKAFTLVELIIVITILAILASIAFISFQNYTKDARDGNRLATITQLEKGLELYSIKTGNYPTPDGPITILSGGTIPQELSHKGYIGETVAQAIKVSKLPIDPYDKTQKYIYATTPNKKLYQIATIQEGNIVLQTPFINQTYAFDPKYKARVQGNFKAGTVVNGIPLFSLIFGGTGNAILDTNTPFITNSTTFSGATISNLPELKELVKKINEKRGEETLTETELLEIFTGQSQDETLLQEIKEATGNTQTSNESTSQTPPQPTTVNGKCGTAHNTPTLIQPTNNLCATGNPTPTQETTNQYTWSCEGVNGGTTDTSCSATKQYSITSSVSGSNGTVSCTPNPVNHGSSVTCTAEPNVNYVVDTWTADCSGTSTTCNLSNVTSNKTATVSFKLKPYASCTTAGTILTATTTYLGCNQADIILCSGPGAGYTISSCNVGSTTAGLTPTSYGKYFQWGENVAWDASSNVGSANNCTWNRDTQVCVLDTGPHSSLPTTVSDTTSGGSDRWQDYGDTRGPCAPGYKVPSSTEWTAIHTAGGWGTSGTNMQNALKLPYAGVRSYAYGSLDNATKNGYYWSTTPDASNARGLYFGSSSISPSSSGGRAYGFSVRCIKN